MHAARGDEAGTGSVSPVTAALAAVALIAFAANSLLNRAALASSAIDAATFTAIRIASGAALLAALTARRGISERRLRGGWWGAGFLAGYAVLFSFAYVALSAATGALLLFGAVQGSMLTVSLLRREPLRPPQWSGFLVAAAGLAWLLAPGVARPEWLPALAMIAAGVCWGAYSVLGIEGGAPLASTTGNFVRAVPLVAAVALLSPVPRHLTGEGVALAVVSGAVTSGLGYAIWYRVLPALGPFRAGVGQLAVPVLAAFAGEVLLGEPLTARLIASEVLVLGGIAVALTTRRGIAPARRGTNPAGHR